jgi:hypothetical protein
MAPIFFPNGALAPPSGNDVVAGSVARRFACIPAAGLEDRLACGRARDGSDFAADVPDEIKLPVKELRGSPCP